MESKKTGIAIEDSGMDWITITTIEESDTDYLLNQARIVLDTEEALGAIKQPWAAMGYRGHQCGSARLGVRNGREAILIVTGSAAKLYGDFVRPYGDRITRLDVQVTIRLERPDPKLAEKVYRTLQALKGQGQYRPAIKYISSDTGSTVYSGSRKSAKLLRLYDKSSDYGEDQLGTCWRYEVQYNRRAAPGAWTKIDSYEAEAAKVAALVYSEFASRKMQPLFSVVDHISAIEVGRKYTDAQTKLTWLTKCVRPVIIQLCALGYEEGVINSLSLRGLIKGVKTDGPE